MTARIIDGNALSAEVRGQLAERAATLKTKGINIFMHHLYSYRISKN